MLLDGVGAICLHMSRVLKTTVGRDRVRAWHRAGAPIRVLHEGAGRRYTSESEALERWVSGVDSQLPAAPRTFA